MDKIAAWVGVGICKMICKYLSIQLSWWESSKENKKLDII